jgi:steroid 5-alpha reductase family enzyme
VNPLAFLAATAVGLSLVMAAAWLIALRSGQSGWVDAIWSLATGCAGVAVSLLPLGEWQQPTPRQLIVALLAGLWSRRLGLHIVARTRKGGDDPRYAQLRKDWGDDFRMRLFWFLQIQAASALLLVIAIAAAAHNPAPGLRAGDWLGIALLAIAIGGETIADSQLARFRADPANKGRICDVGLWGVSRHPNYFFEWLGWLAYAAIAIDLTGAYPFGWAALCGPIFMYWLLVHVSGIPPLEAHMLKSRGEAFRAYQHRVNAFWPGQPVRPSSMQRPGRQNP